MRPRRVHVLADIPLVVAALIATPAWALAGQAEPPPTISVPRVQTPPRLDEVASGQAPAGMLRVEGFRQREPSDGDPVSRETTAYLGYDDRNIYAVFVCREEPRLVRARMAKRESIMGDDLVGIFLDTFHDRRRAYEFIVNPLGIQLDGIMTEGQEDDYSFDTVWRSEGRLTRDGYVVLIAIPFRNLRFNDGPSQTWGIGMARAIPLRNETSFWPYVTRKIVGVGEQFATATGINRISPGRNLQFIPYGAFTGSRYLDETAPAYDTNREGRIGLDGKAVLKDALTVDFTVNPDFSQVESDEPQVTINQRFEVFFPEKRPFFIENAGMFSTQETLFFSRRIADPQFGGRITGKSGRWTLAGLAMDDRARGARELAGDLLHGQRAGIGVIRVQRDIGRKSTIGVFASGLDFGPTFNAVLSADTRLQLSPNWVAIGQVIRTSSTGRDGTRSTGLAYGGGLSYSSRTRELDMSYGDRSPGYWPELGYIERTDIRQAETSASYKVFPEKSRVLSYRTSADASVIWNHANQLEDWRAGPAFEIELPRGTEVSVEASSAYERFEGIGFRRHRVEARLGSDWLQWLTFSVSALAGTGLNYYPGPGRLPFLADRQEAEASMTFRPSSRLRVENTYIFSRLATRQGDAPRGVAPGLDIFNLHLVRTKANYQFNRELSLRAIVDYQGVLPNAALVDLSGNKRFGVDVLVTYLVNPGTALYIGYTDLYSNVTLDPAGRMIRPIANPTASQGRQLFLKLSYLLRY